MRVRIYREGLAELLKASVVIELLGVVSPIDDGSKGFPVQPHIVLLDCGDPDCFLTARVTLRAFSGAKLVGIGGGESAEQVDACAKAGICGYVPADASFDDLIATIEGLARGAIPCSPAIAAALVRRATSFVAGEPVSAIGLTRREVEVVGWLRDGFSNKEIAGQLDIEVATVKNHVHNILRKLAVHRRADAATATFGRG